MKVSARLFDVEADCGSWLGMGALVLLAASLASCAQPPQQHARRHGREYFSVAKYGPASPRMVEDGEPVPRGGGQYLVGHPYTIAGHTYYPGERPNYTAVGMASWYGDAFQGRRTANGEVYDMRSLSAAHPTMPLPSYARVTNLANGYSVIVRVNDRGPYHGGRVMDVSSRVADVLEFKGAGTARVKVDYIGRAPLEGSDDSTLLASLRTDGAPARIEGMPSAPVMVASAQESVASIVPPFLRSPARRAAPVAAESERGEAEADDTPVVAEPHTRRISAPPPPPRPFDLGEITRAIGPVAMTPPHRRPIQQASAADRALYFDSGLSPASSLLRRRDPFAKLREPGKGLRDDELLQADR